MTGGFAALPIAEDGGDHDNGTHLAGESRILGPKWLQLPALSIGLLGVQMLWSVEMSYGMHTYVFLSLLDVHTYCRNTVPIISGTFKVCRVYGLLSWPHIRSSSPTSHWYGLYFCSRNSSS